jgi:PII-like signaling protein
MTNQGKGVRAKSASNRVRRSAVASSPEKCFNPSVSGGKPPARQQAKLEGAGGGEGERMLTTGKAVKVTVYVSDGAKFHHVPVYTSILDFLFQSGVAGATVLKGVAGFGARHRMHAAHILEISDHLPIRIEFIETREKADAVLPELEKRIGSGLIEVQETTIIVPHHE